MKWASKRASQPSMSRGLTYAEERWRATAPLRLSLPSRAGASWKSDRYLSARHTVSIALRFSF